MKWLYSAGDSFVFGDELLESLVGSELLSPFKGQKFDLEALTKFNDSDPAKYQQLASIKDSFTFVGQAAKVLGLKHINFAQPGASIDSILVQVHLIINDIKRNNRSFDDCYIVVGLTSPWRKQYISIDYLSPDMSDINRLLLTLSGSLMLFQPMLSIWNKKELAKTLGKEFSIDQILLDYALRLASIDHALTSVKVNYKLLNLWNFQLFSLIQNSCMHSITFGAVLDSTNTLSKIYPKYPDSFSSLLPGSQLPGGHPTKETHLKWSAALVDIIKKDIQNANMA